MNKKLDSVFFVGVVLGAIGIAMFWFFGWNGYDDAAAASIIVAGVCSWVGVLAKVVEAIRNRNGAID